MAKQKNGIKEILKFDFGEKMKIKKYLLLIVITLAGFTYPQQVNTLTLNESIKIGLENSNFLHSSKLQLQYAESKMNQTDKLKLPALSFSAVYTRLSPIDPFAISTPFGNFDLTDNIVNSYNLKVTLQQPIFTGFKLQSASEMAEFSYLAQKYTLTKDELELILNIKNAYWNLFKAEKMKILLDENVGLIKAHLTDVQNLFQQGMATKNDVLKVQVQLSEVEIMRIDAENGVKLASLNLINTIQLPLNTQIQISKDIQPGMPVNYELGSLVDEALQNRPELKSLDFNLKATESNIKMAKSDWYPQLYLVGNYNYANPNQRVFPQEAKFKGTWDVSLSLNMNLWNWNSTGDATDQAEIQLEQVKDAGKILKDGITLEVTQNYLNIGKFKEKISAALNNVNQAEENYRVTNDKFKNGLTTNSELLDAEVALLQAKTNYIQALVDYEMAKASLEKSIGQK